MRILVLRSEPPWPLCYGGRLHCYELCQRLAARHELLMLAARPGEEPHPPFDFECRVAAGGAPTHPTDDAIFARMPLDRLDHYFGIDAGFIREAAHCVRTWRPDLVIGMNYPSLAWLARLSGVPMLCDLLDDETLHAWRELRSRPHVRTWQKLKSLAAIALFERRYLHRMTAVTVLSDPDARWCRRQARTGWWHRPVQATGAHTAPTRVACIPHGVDCDYFTPAETPGNDNEIIFWGGLTFRPNISALLHFARRVWPLIRERRPDVRWTIVGWGDPPELEPLRSMPGVRFTGRVPDLRPHIAPAAVAVVPMVSGAGIKNKIMEAWAMAKPVVCTPIALGSLPGEHGRNVWVARSPRAQAEGVLTLLADAELRRRMGRAARDTAVRHCSWDQAVQRFEQLCMEVASPLTVSNSKAPAGREAFSHAAA